MSDALTMAEAAAAVGLSAERFRHVWRRWQRELGFPAPFLRPPAAHRYAWRSEAIEIWKTAREGAFGVGHAPPANDVASPLDRADRRLTPKLKRERAELLKLMNRGA